MKKVYWVQGQNLETLEYKEGMSLFDGDVYAFDDPDSKIIWIWIGKDSSVEESTVGAWLVNKIDQERDGVPEVMTINQGEEPMPFKENFDINVIDDDTPGFLKKAELDVVEYKLFKVYIKEDTSGFDDAIVEPVDISRKSLTSDDVYVLDSNGAIYCWIGKNSQLEEKRMGQKIMNKIDSERQYLPLQYTITEGEESKSERSFYELLNKIESMDKSERTTVSIEDQRELKYVPEEAKTVEEAKEEADKKFETTDPSKVPERQIFAGTQEHKDLITKGSSVRAEELPKMGTVAARLAAIKSRQEEKEKEDK